MSRAARIKADSGIYHVILRGINRQIIFEDDADRERFLGCLRAVREASGFTLYAYCLMDNHVHLLIEETGEPLGCLMKRLGVRYVRWFNARYARTGHLFQDRFWSEPVDTDAYFVAVLRYIWRNPVKAGLCKRPQDFPWSSRRWLGRRDGLVQDADLYRRTGVTDLEAFDTATTGDPGVADHPIWTPPGHSDHQISALVREVSSLDGIDEVRQLPRNEQRPIVRVLRGRGVPVKQLGRLTGIPLTTLEHWSA